MRSQLDAEDIDLIADKVVEKLKPLIPSAKQEEPVLDVPGLCEYLKVTPKWIHQRTHMKEIPFYKLSNKQLRFRKRDIDKWLESLKTPALNRFTGRMRQVV